jgi:hypothetical protein
MAVTNFSPLLGLALPTTGDLSGTWGTTVNDSITGLIDSAVAGTATLSTDADVTLTTTNGAANQARNMVLLCSGARTTIKTITAPAQSKTYVVINATTGGFAVKLVGAGPTTGVTIVAGESAVCAWNGSDFIKVSSTVANAGGSNTQVQFNSSGILAGSANMTFNGTTLTVNDLTDSSLTATRVVYAGTGGNLTGASTFVFDGTNLGVGTGSPNTLLTVNGGSVMARFRTGSATDGRIEFAYNTTDIGYINMPSTSLLDIYARSGVSLAFGANASEGMRLTSTGLGIGTSSPASKLDVVGAANTGDPALPFQLRIASTEAYNTTPTSGILFVNKYNTGGSVAGMGGISVYKENATDGNYASALALFTRPNAGSVTKVATFDSSGNLGLGVTPSAWASFTAIQIGETGCLASNAFSAANTQTFLGNNAYYNAGFKYIATGSAAAIYNITTNEHRWSVAASGTAGDAITFTQAMTLNASGNLGVGITSPTAKVHSVSDTPLRLNNAAATSQADLYFVDSGATLKIENFFGTGSNITFGTNANGGGTAERARIDSSGNFGIGTTSPSSYSAKLAVVSTGADTRISVVDDVTNVRGGYLRSNFSDAVILGTTSGVRDLVFSPDNTERMRINTTGNVGINTSAPGQKLDVNGSIRSRDGAFIASIGTANKGLFCTYNQIFGSGSDYTPTIFAETGLGVTFAVNGSATKAMSLDSSGNLLVGTTSQISASDRLEVQGTNGIGIKCTGTSSNACELQWHSATSGDNLFTAFYTETLITQRGSITYNRTAGLVSYNTTSDYRAKDIYGPVTGSGALIDSTPVYMGTMKGATQERPMFIAHETPNYAHTGEKDAVDADGNPVYQQMDASALIPVMWAEIQSLRKRLADAGI